MFELAVMEKQETSGNRASLEKKDQKCSVQGSVHKRVVEVRRPSITLHEHENLVFSKGMLLGKQTMPKSRAHVQQGKANMKQTPRQLCRSFVS